MDFSKTVTTKEISLTNLNILLEKLIQNVKTEKDQVIFNIILNTPVACINFRFMPEYSCLTSKLIGGRVSRIYDEYMKTRLTIKIASIIEKNNINSQAFIGIDNNTLNLMALLYYYDVCEKCKECYCNHHMNEFKEIVGVFIPTAKIVTKTYENEYGYIFNGQRCVIKPYVQPSNKPTNKRIKWLNPTHRISLFELKTFHNQFLKNRKTRREYNEVFNRRVYKANFYDAKDINGYPYYYIDRLSNGFHLINNKLSYYVTLKSNIDFHSCEIGVSERMYNLIKNNMYIKKY